MAVQKCSKQEKLLSARSRVFIGINSLAVLMVIIWAAYLFWLAELR